MSGSVARTCRQADMNGVSAEPVEEFVGDLSRGEGVGGDLLEGGVTGGA